MNARLFRFPGCGLLACFLAFGLQSLGQTFEVSPSTVAGVDLLGPANFGDLLLKLVPDQAARDALKPAIPYSVVVRNGGSRNIVYCTVRFDFLNIAGKPVSAIARRDYRVSPAFAPGGSHWVAPVGGFTQAVDMGKASSLQHSSSYTVGLQQLANVTQSATIRASLDAVVFDNGELVGPDRSGTFAVLAREADQVKSLVNELRQMDIGSTDEAISARLDQITQEKPKDPLGVFPLLKRRRVAVSLKGQLTKAGRQGFHDSLTGFSSSSTGALVVWRQ
jgi:hypothetical protein